MADGPPPETSPEWELATLWQFLEEQYPGIAQRARVFLDVRRRR